jgi:hypothetical protein
MAKHKRQIKYRSEQLFGAYESIIPETLIAKREEIKATLPENLQSTVHFEIDSHSYAYDSNTYYSVCMKWQEYETDDEYNARVKQETTFMVDKEKRERAEFERLKKKYA